MTYDLLALSFENMEDLDSIAERILADTHSSSVITFQSYTTGEILSFPAELYNRMTGSNGMASGNTVLEAILHGLSEIFERAALEYIFLNPVTPPVIDKTQFEGCDVLNRLDRLQRKGITYFILDCSLGMGWPVIALLLKKGEKYHIQFGSDPSPITALERCLTETFQGKDLDSLPLYPLLQETIEKKMLFNNARREFKKSRGRVLVWVIQGTPSWQFTGFEHPVSRSDEEDMEYYIHILNDMGKQLYVMDNSFLGFPTMRLFVPGMSHIYCPESENGVSTELPKSVKTMLCRLPLLSDKEYHELSLQIQDWLESCFGIYTADDFLH